MTGRIAGLVLLTLCELLAGLGLRNEALASRSRTEQYNRNYLEYEQHNAHYQHLYRLLTSPDALRARMEYIKELAEVEQLPEL